MQSTCYGTSSLGRRLIGFALVGTTERPDAGGTVTVCDAQSAAD